MANEQQFIDLTDFPEVARLADAVREARRPFELRRGEEVIATIVPAGYLRAPAPTHRQPRRDIEADLEAIRASAGSWKGLLDAERLKREIKEARGSDRPDISL